jgi:soluble lytic murein transglycosylase-like protein
VGYCCVQSVRKLLISQGMLSSSARRRTLPFLYGPAGWVCLALILGTASPATAQIYSWRDENGNLVLSNTGRPPQGTAWQSYAVPQAEGVRATNYVPSEKTRTYDDLIVEHAQLHGVRAALVRAVVQVESAYNPRATSPKGAMGLMQLMPATARQFGVRNPYNPEENVRAGVAYLRQLLDRYDNNEELALAAYNAGPGAVDRYGEAVPPYRETRNYVTKVNKIAGVKQLPNSKIYQVTKIVDGRAVVYYTNQKPEEAPR